MEAKCIKKFKEDRLQELETAARESLEIIKRNNVMQPESDVEEGESDDKEDEDRILEDEEWNGIGNDNEWETEDDGDEDEDEDALEESIIDVSDNEILYDKDGNIIEEEDIAEGLKEIIGYHINKLKKRLDMFATLASTEDKDKDEEDEETRGEME